MLDLTLGPLLQGQTVFHWLWRVVFSVDINLHRSPMRRSSLVCAILLFTVFKFEHFGDQGPISLKDLN